LKDQLTNREKEILALILNEYSSLDIATTLNLSIRTIDTHRKNILRKTNTKTLIGLFKFAVKAGLIEDYLYKPTSIKPGRKYT
jgi:DNA-binding CsgD family transcriptional regulator